MARRLPSNIEEKLAAAVDKGLERADPNMVRVANEMIKEDDASEILRDLSFTVVPYTVADESLFNIVLRAPDYVIEEVERGLAERKRRKLALDAEREAQENLEEEVEVVGGGG